MRLSQIRDFISVVDAGSISAGARRLGVSQPGLTKSIGSLEQELAAPLLRRTGRGVSLTPYGRAFYSRAKAAHSELGKAQEEIVQMLGTRRGTVAVGFGPLAAALVLPRAVLRFRQQFPEVELRLIEGFAHALMPLTRDATLDMMIGPRLPGHRGDPAVRFRPLFHNDQVIVGRRGHPLAQTRTACALAGATWLSFEPKEVIGAILRSLGVAGTTRLIQCESLNVMVGLLLESDMLAVVSSRLMTMPNAGQHLVRIPVVERIPSLTTGLFTRADVPLTPAAAALAASLVDAGRQLPALDRDSRTPSRAKA